MSKLVSIISFFIFFFGVIILSAFLVMNSHFSSLTIEQIIFHIRVWDKIFINSNSTEMLIEASVFSAISFIVLYAFLWRKMTGKRRLVVSLFFFVMTVFVLDYKYNLFDYIYKRTMITDLYEKNYVDPRNANIKFPEKKKNLVLIYWESVEKIYQNVDLEGTNLLKEVSILEKKFGSLGNYKQIAGAGWTMAGIVSSSCGIPLMATMSSGYGTEGHFLPNVACLQDVLEENGYYQILIRGVNNEFSGMNVFLNDHGKNKTMVIDELSLKKAADKNIYGNTWGVKDSVMLEAAKNELLQASKRSPFFATIITVDTHMPDGYLDDMCVPRFGEDYRDVIACNDKTVSAFVQWIMKQDFYKDTMIVIIGDHLAMSHLIDQKYIKYYNERERDIFNLVVSDNKRFSSDRNFAAIDLFPTIMEGIGAEWNNKRLGLGVSVWDNNGETLIEKMGIDKLNDHIVRYNKIYDKFLFFGE